MRAGGGRGGKRVLIWRHMCPFMVTQTGRNNSRGAAAAAGADELIFDNDERIEIASMHPT